MSLHGWVARVLQALIVHPGLRCMVLGMRGVCPLLHGQDWGDGMFEGARGYGRMEQCMFSVFTRLGLWGQANINVPFCMCLAVALRVCLPGPCIRSRFPVLHAYTRGCLCCAHQGRDDEAPGVRSVHDEAPGRGIVFCGGRRAAQEKQSQRTL